MKYAIKKSNENFVFHGYKELRKTTAGKTGIGLEVVIDGAVAQKDMNKATIMAFYDHGFKWMMPKYENRELVRPGFFYKGFDTKAKRDKQYDAFMKENKKFAERLRDCINSYPLPQVPAKMAELDDVHSPLTEFNYSRLYYFKY